MPKVLDRSRPFGEVWGGESNVRYVQDDTEFDAQGDEIVKKAGRPKKGQDEAPADDNDAQLAAQLGE